MQEGEVGPHYDHRFTGIPQSAPVCRIPGPRHGMKNPYRRDSASLGTRPANLFQHVLVHQRCIKGILHLCRVPAFTCHPARGKNQVRSEGSKLARHLRLRVAVKVQKHCGDCGANRQAQQSDQCLWPLQGKRPPENPPAQPSGPALDRIKPPVDHVKSLSVKTAGPTGAARHARPG